MLTVWPCSSLAPWVCLGVNRTAELVKGQVKDGLLVPDGIGLDLLMGSLRFSLLAVPTVPLKKKKCMKKGISRGR